MRYRRLKPSKILDNLFLGRCVSNPAHILELKQEGVTHVLNLQTDEEIRSEGASWEELSNLYQQEGLDATRYPILDFQTQDTGGTLSGCLSCLSLLQNNGHTVYVHCSAGYNRSPTLVIAYLIRLEGFNNENAISFVEHRHNCLPDKSLLRRL